MLINETDTYNRAVEIFSKLIGIDSSQIVLVPRDYILRLALYNSIYKNTLYYEYPTYNESNTFSSFSNIYKLPLFYDSSINLFRVNSEIMDIKKESTILLGGNPYILNTLLYTDKLISSDVFTIYNLIDYDINNINTLLYNGIDCIIGYIDSVLGYIVFKPNVLVSSNIENILNDKEKEIWFHDNYITHIMNIDSYRDIEKNRTISEVSYFYRTLDDKGKDRSYINMGHLETVKNLFLPTFSTNILYRLSMVKIHKEYSTDFPYDTKLLSSEILSTQIKIGDKVLDIMKYNKK